MGMPLELNTMIVTKGREERIENNFFKLEKDEYRLYPMHIPLEVKNSISGEIRGIAEIYKLEWSDQKTLIYFELKSLESTN
ncbi:DUF2584 family protein [Jeotgalibacillus salarius]|uniref:DUF2584 family protein n=1 Tax=Jeotgalibacillus salarius TaxID=546023 RepID=A0A4Y8L7J0_9BACL|nr:DUF2584 family protein [Jeotgalibacillus salarius]TFD98251.1 DUF2584 family protein [Jeotgalibacillus salarius]